MESSNAHVIGRFGRQIREARRRYNMSQDEFAELIGVTREYVSHLERGHATKQVQRLVDALDAVGLTLVAQPKGVASVTDDYPNGASDDKS